ncbi:MAG: universal stress protein [Ilumatobacteraceae bacterium]
MASALGLGGWDGPLAGRIAIPVAADRTPDVTTRLAVTVGRQAGLGLEFVDAAAPAHRDERARALRRRCAAAVAGGASCVGWEVVDGGARDVGPYITWSGAALRCIGTDGHRRSTSRAVTGGCAVPLLVAGPRWRPPPLDGYRHLVVGLDGDSWHNEPIATCAMDLARWIDADITLVGVVAPGPGFADVVASAHLHWIAAGLDHPPLFETVSARDPATVLAGLLDDSSLLVVGAPCHHRSILGGLAGSLVRRVPFPILVVPVTSPRGCCRSVVVRPGGDRRYAMMVAARGGDDHDR